MTIYQFSLIFISGVLFTLGSFYLLRTVFIYKKNKKFLSFSLLCLCSFLYTSCQYILSTNTTDMIYLIFHRIKLFAAFGAGSGILLLIYTVFLKNYKIIRLFFILGLIFLIIMPFDIFTSFPIHHITIEKWGIKFFYSFGTTKTLYSIFLIYIISFILFSFLKAIFSKISKKFKIYIILMITPVVISVLNDFLVSHHLLKNIMLSEYLIFIFIAVLFVIFMSEEQHNYRKIINHNTELEKEVSKRTSQLKKQNYQLFKDLETAKRIQMSMFPEKDLSLFSKKIKYKSIYNPIDQLGGDFFDIIILDKKHIAFIIADVSGHGAAAALITSMLKISFRNHSSSLLSTAEICNKVNKDLYNSIGGTGRFSSVFYVILNIESGKLQFTSAGHPPAILYDSKNEKIKVLKTNGAYLGIFETPTFNYKNINLNTGDKIFMYTDGIIEARNKNKEFYGFERLKQFIFDSRHLELDKTIENLIINIDDFTKKQKIKDDQAILYISYI